MGGQFRLPPRFPILYVEDEEEDLFLMQRAFAKASITHPFKSVADGQAAIDYLQGTGRYADRQEYPLPGLILLDLNLPHASGFEVLQWIREHAETHSVLVICSSSGEAQDIQQAYELGANGYVCKPGSFEQLLALVCAIKEFWLVHNRPPAFA